MVKPHTKLFDDKQLVESKDIELESGRFESS
jgi:hypothetical protein